MNKQILINAGIDPNKVISMNIITITTCEWCDTLCGSRAKLEPCNHLLCFQCTENVVDDDQGKCPLCQETFNDFTWI